jgi:2-polyprenyl-3-methyl-5-hydroxy-6-metoxy-1,4-benzoquinol methylase
MATPQTELMSTLNPLIDLLRCIECGSTLALEPGQFDAGYPELGPDGLLRCRECGQLYPIIGGTARMLDRAGRSRLARDYPASTVARHGEEGNLGPSSAEAIVKQQTAESFAYEWHHFGAPRTEWRKNFFDYMQPHDAEFFRDLLMLDVGAGSGRHSAQAALHGARVVAVDLGQSIDVTRRNVPPEVLTVQADAERLPFAHGTFDFVMSIGVLHHLPEPERALRSLVPYARPGGRVHVYLYWQPELAWHRWILRGVTAARRVTVRMPHALLHQLCYPLAAALWVSVVLPYRALRHRSTLTRIAEGLPLKTYADYPFQVLVNDQFDRFSAPLEQRFTKAEVKRLLDRAGLQDATVLPNHGWVADGRVPATGS